MRSFKIGIIGTGAITGKHADAIAEIENAELVDLSGQKPPKINSVLTLTQMFLLF